MALERFLPSLVVVLAVLAVPLLLAPLFPASLPVRESQGAVGAAAVVGLVLGYLLRPKGRRWKGFEYQAGFYRMGALVASIWLVRTLLVVERAGGEPPGCS